MSIQKLTILQSDGTETTLTPSPIAPPSTQLVKDTGLRVPPAEQGQFVQILDDTAVLGAPRQIVDGLVEKFDFPAVVNTEWGLRTRYPGYNGRVYDYVTLPDDFAWLKYELLRWAASYKLERGAIIGYEFIHNGDHAIVEPKNSMWWVWTELIVDGKSHTDGPNVEQWGRRDPITLRNPTAENFAWLMRPFTGAIVRIVEDRGTQWGYEVLDITKPAPSLEYVLARPWLYCWGVSSTRTKLGSRYVTDDYPQIAEAFKVLGLPRTGTPILNMGLGGVVWIDKRACSPILEAGAAWSPYYPAK